MNSCRRVGLVGVLVAVGSASAVGTPAPLVGTISVDLTHIQSRVTPRAIGAGFDGHETGDNAKIFTPTNLRAMRSAGFGSMSYRLRTELGVEAWHWNPVGSWSDPAAAQGYWTSSAHLRHQRGASFGYRLPRRGATADQANDDGYSRLDDGNPGTFWKSNPYLDPHFAGPRIPAQWMLIDFGRARPIDALRINWGAPYARRVIVQRWAGSDAVGQPGRLIGHWQRTSLGRFIGTGGDQAVRIAARPQPVRFLRILMSNSSHTAPAGARDVRDRLGFAVREVFAGRFSDSRLVDVMRHGASNTRQSVMYVSSTDPWHRSSDLDPHTEQPSLRRVITSGIGTRAPILVPAAVLYGTPEDAAQELRYLKTTGVRLRGVELGEEPDGQLATPQDYGALYAQFAHALRRVDRNVPLGGPSFQTSRPDWAAWPDRSGNRSWVHQFLATLRARHAARDLQFFSFEWYPFDNVCAPAGPRIVEAPGLLAAIIARLHADGLDKRLPLFITEYGYSAFAGRAEVDLPGAIFDAEVAAKLLTLGGSASYFYGLEPNVLIHEAFISPSGNAFGPKGSCSTWGNLALLASDDSWHVGQPYAAFHAMRLVTQAWMEPGTGSHLILPAISDIRDSGGRPLVTAYASRRPDGQLALLMFNKDTTRTASVTIRVSPDRATGPTNLYQFSRAQYVWHAAGAKGFARPNRPPAHTVLAAGGAVTVALPPMSISVARTALTVGST